MKRRFRLKNGMIVEDADIDCPLDAWPIKYKIITSPCLHYKPGEVIRLIQDKNGGRPKGELLGSKFDLKEEICRSKGR